MIVPTQRSAQRCEAHLVFEASHQKTTQALNYLACRYAGRINRVKALKLVFFADRYHLRKYGRPVTGDTYWAMNKGPVASLAANLAAYDRCAPEYLEDAERDYAAEYLAPHSGHDVASRKAVDTEVFSESDVEALDFALAKFGSLTPWQLYRVTHAYPEWRKRSVGLRKGGPARAPMYYADFFLDPDPDDPDLQAVGGRDPYVDATTDHDKALALEIAQERSAVQALWDR